MTFFSVAARLGLCAVVAAAGCSKSNFGGSKSAAVPKAKSQVAPAAAPTDVGQSTATPDAGDNKPAKVETDAFLDLPCEAEFATTFSVKATEGMSRHLLNLSPTCSSVRKTSTTVGDTVDIVFVLDVTGSMGPSSFALRETIQKFVVTLSSRGWDARFAAVAFRDTGDNSSPPGIPFGSAADISLGMDQPGWEARGGGGEGQEGFQDAVGEAVRIIKDTGRPSAQKVILLITDIAGYAMAPVFGVPSSRTDFSVTTLAANLKSAGVGPLKFYCSVGDKDSKLTMLPEPTTQCNDIRKQSGLVGENLPFPLTENVLNEQFAAKFRVVNSSEELTCHLQSAQIDGAAAAVKLESGGQRLVLGNEAEVAASGGKVVEVKRCCSAGGAVAAAGACSDPVTLKVILEASK